MLATVAAPAKALELLWERPSEPDRPERGAGMPAELAWRAGGPITIPLRTDRPTVVANFVASVDGIVALGTGDRSGGSLISGGHEPDRLVMAVLRALADVVVVGAGTLRESTRQRWTAGHLQPDLAPELEAWRGAMGLAPNPTTVIVSGSGDIPTAHPGLVDPAIPVVIATTRRGVERLRTERLASNVSVEALGDGRSVDARDLLRLVTDTGAALALCEGGPRLLGELVGADLLDELFLTLAPQLLGRADPARLALLEGIAQPAWARPLELAGIRRSTSHLFLRYRRGRRQQLPEEAAP